MLFSRKRKKSPEHSLYLDGTCLNNAKSHKHLGLELSSDLSWSLHIETICSKSRQRLALLKSYKLQLNRYTLNQCYISYVRPLLGGGPRVVVSTAAFHARVRGSVPGLGGLKETKLFLPHPRVKVSIVGSLRDREVACSASDRQGSNFESCVWRTVSSQSSHHPQEVLLAQFSLYVHKGGLKPDSFHFIFRPLLEYANIVLYRARQVAARKYSI